MQTEAEVQDNAAQYYEKRYSGFGLRYHTEVVRWLMGEAKGNVLDAGCGNGFLSRLYYGTSLKITGVDISSGMLAKHPGPFIQCSVSELPFPDNHFDFVLCRSLLHHLPYPDPAVKEMYRVLKPGGHFAAWETNAGKIAQMVRKRTQHGDRFSEFHHAFSSKELRTMISKYFKVDQVRHMGFTQYPLWGFPDIKDFTPHIPCNEFFYKLAGKVDGYLERIPVINQMSWALGIRAHK